MPIGTVCPTCRFENPRSWRACAACGRPLGAGFRPTSVTQLGGGDATVVSAHPDFEGDVDDLESLDSVEIEDEGGGEPEGEGEIPLIGQAEAAGAIQTGVERAFTVGAPTLVALEGPRGS
ncbi:MAG TPA: hypothetical protein RMI62_18715, partial [Polyangiaceae bacterium LLY-WYZ-15_(1-7)]|nr:hypothetical protein [Polyangiaceae bacterium LLY-WYZ-15_(1-7)]